MLSEILSKIILFFIAIVYFNYIVLEVKESIANDENFPEKRIYQIIYAFGSGIFVGILLPFYFSFVLAEGIHNKLNEEKP